MQFCSILEDIFQRNVNLWFHIMAPPELHRVMQNISTALHASFLLRELLGRKCRILFYRKRRIILTISCSWRVIKRQWEKRLEIEVRWEQMATNCPLRSTEHPGSLSSVPRAVSSTPQGRAAPAWSRDGSTHPGALGARPAHPLTQVARQSCEYQQLRDTSIGFLTRIGVWNPFRSLLGSLRPHTLKVLLNRANESWEKKMHPLDSGLVYVWALCNNEGKESMQTPWEI